MSGSFDESKITAFALGDLAGEERVEVEHAVAADPELAARVEAIRATAGSIERGFQAEPLPDPPVRPRHVAPRWSLWLTGAAAAACAVLAICLPTDTARPGPSQGRDGLFVCAVHGNCPPPGGGGNPQAGGHSLPWADDPTPLCERFYAGGSGTVSGFTFRNMRDSEKYKTAVLPDSGSVSPAGGPSGTGVVGGCATVTGNNEDFVSYEDNDELLTLEEGLGGLNVDSNCWKNHFEGTKTAKLEDVRAAIKSVRGLGPTHEQVLAGWRGLLARHRDLQKAIAGTGLPPGVQGPEVEHNTEGYDEIVENSFLTSLEEPLSTFSIDVDTASYANVRRFLTGGQLPPPDAVRIEELVNYFTYEYAPPTDDQPFAVHMEMASCPWKPEHKLLRIGLKGRTLEKRPPSNLVFLIDVSGSMQDANKLPLVQRALSLLVNQLSESDRVSIVVYAGASGLVLPPTTGDKKARILDAIERLSAGGSTNGGAGIELAYALAAQNFVQGGTNRVVLATDGDWNVGTTSHGALETLIAEKAKTGVFLSVLGFGMGNLKDDTLERLADKGNGNYAYVDSVSEARKVLVEQMTGTLCTIAKDVKLQIEFNPARIAGYRLIGYENRVLAKEDFNDDKKDAGEIGAGHTVTALYELVPAGQEVPGGRPPVDPLKYQQPKEGAPDAASLDLCTVKLRYKAPEASESTLMEVPLKQGRDRFDDASADFRFASAVAGYGMLLRRSEYAKGFTWEAVSEIASGALGEDREGYRKEFLDLVKRAKDLSGK